MAKYVYLFQEGNANMRELLGGKGANLAEMANLGQRLVQRITMMVKKLVKKFKTKFLRL